MKWLLFCFLLASPVIAQSNDTVSLLRYFEASLAASEKNFQSQIDLLRKDFELADRLTKDSVDVRFDSQKESVLQALAAADRAVMKAETAAEKRFESVNEFRNTLSDQQRNLMPRSEVTAIVTALSDKIDVATKQLDALQAERVGIKGGWGYAVGVVGFVAIVITLIWNLRTPHSKTQ